MHYPKVLERVDFPEQIFHRSFSLGAPVREVFSRKHRAHCLKAVSGYWCKTFLSLQIKFKADAEQKNYDQRPLVQTKEDKRTPIGVH